jgi:hypothetical protein
MLSVVVNPTAERKNEDGKMLTAEFPHIFDGVCHLVMCPECHFMLKEGPVPAAFRRSLPVSEPLLPRLKKELDLLEEKKKFLEGNCSNSMDQSDRDRVKEGWSNTSAFRFHNPQPQHHLDKT